MKVCTPFVLKLFIKTLLINIVNIVSTSAINYNPSEQVLTCEQQNLKLQLEISNLKLEILKLREGNPILLNEKENCTIINENFDSISLSLKNIQEDLEPLKNSFREKFNLNRNDIETIQQKSNIENHTILREWKQIEGNLTAVVSQVVSESLEPLLRELKANNRGEQKLIQSCSEADKFGVYKLQLPNSNIKPFEVFCDEKNWLVVLRRIDGSVDFQRPWQDYKDGFGNIAGNFFIGLENLYQLTSLQCHELMVVLLDFENIQKYSKYDRFQISSEAEDYSLNVLGKYSGTAGSALRDSETMKFSTFDRDNDNSNRDCAGVFKGGWWHNNCGNSKLTGIYQPYSKDSTLSGIEWHTWRSYYSYKYAKMMIRPTSC